MLAINAKCIKDIEQNQFFKIVLPHFQSQVAVLSSSFDLQETYIKVLDYLHDILRNAQADVEVYIQGKVSTGKIQNADQARKSASGAIFQRLVAYSILQNIAHGNLPDTLQVSVGKKDHELIKKYASIDVDGETQKPDSDVLLFSDNPSEPIINFSCKTSLRERAGQTYKWKLLVDLASCTCVHKSTIADCPITKYKLKYSSSRKILMCFVTADFYNELIQPQSSGMFSFFDKSFSARRNAKIPKNVEMFSNVIEYINLHIK